MNKVELLAPAGDLKRLKYAIVYGADAVYIGGKRFSLRSRASNFDLPEIAEAVQFANLYQAKVHVTVNMLPHEDDFEGLREYLLKLEEVGVTAVICASVYIAKLAKEILKKTEVHLSTQQSTLNQAALEFYHSLKVDRVVVGRELNINQIEKLVTNSPVLIEGFIHGGMCVNYSGRCTLSNYMTKRDANRGGCAQSCRWKYKVYNKEELISDENILFSMSSKDLMAADYLPELIKMGIASLKIEGRMKSLYYIATVVNAYRQLIDVYYENQAISKEAKNEFLNELARAENRPFSDGFYGGLPLAQDHLYGINGAGVTHDFLAEVISYDKGYALVEVRNYFEKGDLIEVIGPNHYRLKFIIEEIIDEEENQISICNQPMKKVKIKTPQPIDAFFLLRKGVL